MRLGEILVAAGVITPSQLDDALARQKLNPEERLGTQVVHLGLATPDRIAQALAKQHGVPPALVRHFVHHDPKVAALIGPKIAVQHALLPIAFSRAGGRKLVICFRDPGQPGLIAQLEKALGIPVTPCVASELAMSVYLDHYYGLQTKFESRKPARAESEDGIDIDFDDVDDPNSGLDTLQVVELDHQDVERTKSQVFVPESERRSAIRLAVATKEASDAGIDALDLIAAEPAPIPKRTPPPDDSGAPRPSRADSVVADFEAADWLELPDIIAAIDGAKQRAAVSDAIMSFLQQRFAGGMIFTIKDGLAMGHRGFGGHLDDKDTVTALMLPLKKNILAKAHDANELWRGDPSTLSSAAQERFLKLFDLGKAPSEVVVAPVSVANRVVCLIYAHAHLGVDLDDSDVDELAEVAEATERAFASIIKKTRAATISS